LKEMGPVSLPSLRDTNLRQSQSAQNHGLATAHLPQIAFRAQQVPWHLGPFCSYCPETSVRKA